MVEEHRSHDHACDGADDRSRAAGERGHGRREDQTVLYRLLSGLWSGPAQSETHGRRSNRRDPESAGA
jgi:hypothetical protein